MKVIILDRDGVINEDSPDYIKSPAEWVPIPGSIEAIARLYQDGYRVIVASNQSGVGRGLFDLSALHAIHRKMNRAVADAGGAIEAIFFCPHRPEDKCPCRKPKPGLLHEAGERLKVTLRDVPAVGDSLRDIEAAQAVKARPFLVRTGKGEQTLASHGEALTGVEVLPDLAAVTDRLLRSAG